MANSFLEELKGMCRKSCRQSDQRRQKISMRIPTFTVFCSKCAGRRSKKIKKEFIACQGKVVHVIKGQLETASKQGIIKINLNES